MLDKPELSIPNYRPRIVYIEPQKSGDAFSMGIKWKQNGMIYGNIIYYLQEDEQFLEWALMELLESTLDAMKALKVEGYYVK